MKESNATKYPEAWKVYVDCVRKWEAKNLTKYPDGWKYGIPDPTNPTKYLYSHCPGRLFVNFKILFYENNELFKFKKFLWHLEKIEGKISTKEYEHLISCRS